MAGLAQYRNEHAIKALPDRVVAQRDGQRSYQIFVSSAAIGLMTRSTMARS